MGGFDSVEIKERLAPVSAARSGRKRSGFKGVTIHETANYRRSADAQSHATYMQGAGKYSQVSAHYYVDDCGAVRTLPEEEVAWHAGDGTKTGGGNMGTVAIEICENWGYLPPEYAGYQSNVKPVGQATETEKSAAMERFAKAVDNAAQLSAEILHRNGVKDAAGYVWQHNHWSPYKKDCPHNLRKDLPVGWETFKAKAQARLDALWGSKNGKATQEQAEKSGPDTLYRVQVGAFGDKKNAEQLLEQLKKDGYEGVIKV